MSPDISRLLPQGKTAELEAWLNEACKDESTMQMMQAMLLGRPDSVVRLAPDGSLRLRDLWGRPLVYKYPSDAPRYLFRLYSLGPNGVDENGTGLNIDASPVSESHPPTRGAG